MSAETTQTQAGGEGRVVELPRPDHRTMSLVVAGNSPLICHRWSDKARKAMRDKQGRKAVAAREAKDPQAEYRASLYPLPGGGYGFPAIAFKAAMVRAGTYLDFKMTFLRGAFHINGELLPIRGEPEMREDMVRVGAGVADIRYRGQFPRWSVELPIRYNARAISAEQLANLAMEAGFSVGVGEWRPERDGSSGLFTVVTEDEGDADGAAR